MTSLQGVLIGAVQGITEFLPVSSSGHLLLLSRITELPDQGLVVDVWLHLATLFAVCWYFRSDLAAYVRAVVQYRGGALTVLQKEALFLMLSVIPVGAVGVLLETNRQSTSIIAWSFIIWGIVLFVVDRYARGNTKELTTKSALLLSCMQAIALIPGTSRSGITMIAGRLAGHSREQTARLSMLMSIPVILLASGYEGWQVWSQGEIGMTIPIVCAMLVAALTAWAAIHVLMQMVERVSFAPFAWYRVAVGIALLMFFV